MNIYRHIEDEYPMEAYQFNGDIYTIPEKLRWLIKEIGRNFDKEKCIYFIDPSFELSGICVKETEWITADMKVYTDETFKLTYEPLLVQTFMSYEEAKALTKQGKIIRPNNNTADLCNLYLKEVDGVLHIFLYDDEDIGPYIANDGDYAAEWFAEDKSTRVFDPKVLEAMKKAGEKLLDFEDCEVEK